MFDLPELQQLIVHAGYNLLQADSCLISNDVAERCISARLMHHLQLLLDRNCIYKGYYSDAEYNRHGCDIKKFNEKPIYPDIIVHKRMDIKGNLIAIEVKKENASKRAIEGDRKRLRKFTCKSNNNQNANTFQYKLGALYVIDTHSFHIEFYKDGKIFDKKRICIEDKSIVIQIKEKENEAKDN